MILNLQRRFPIGAELQPKGGTHFRVWAPHPKKVEVLLEAGPGAPATAQLKQEADGYFAGLVPQAAQRELAELADCGITVLEVMPVADFPGRFGWGYDGVGQFAPVRLYGEPDDFRRFVDEAHRAGLGVILDVVYNHFGPDGNYLKAFSPDYFTEDLKKFDVSTLIIHGDDDQIVPIGAAALRSSKLVKNATLKIYPGAPHGLAYTIKTSSTPTC
jgi:1,4-alpha-glucan branching enzyme